jgi:hypothetical protein
MGNMPGVTKAFFAVLLAAALASCAKPPVEEMNNAESAVTRAENDTDAVAYASGTLSRARDALNRMRTEAEAKRFDTARTFAAEAVSAAEKALADGRAGAARVREEAGDLVAGLRDSVSGIEESIQAAKRDRNLQIDFTALDGEFDEARRAAEQAEVSLAGQNYDEALDRGRTARSLLSGISGRLGSAASSASRKK